MVAGVFNDATELTPDHDNSLTLCFGAAAGRGRELDAGGVFPITRPTLATRRRHPGVWRHGRHLNRPAGH